MRKEAFTGIAILLTITTCIDAPRDNKYDPKNPNRAYLSASIYEIGLFPLEAATVDLTQNSTIVQSDTSGPDGTAEFEEIVPGIYTICADALHYSTVICPVETLWAGTYLESLRLEFNTLDFEDEIAGTSSPHRFVPLSGSWTIANDSQQPELHSTPNVYRASDIITTEAAVSLCQAETESFLFNARMKVDVSSGNSWRAGLVMRYQDAGNYYRFMLSSDTAYCDLVMNGQTINLQAEARESDPGVWQKLSIEKPDSWIFVRLNVNDLPVFTVYDNVFPGGQVGLITYTEEGSETVTVYFDDVTLDLTYGLQE